MARNGNGKRTERGFNIRLSVDLDNAIRREIERRGITATAWFLELVMEGGMTHSRTKPGKREVLGDDSENEMMYGNWQVQGSGLHNIERTT